MVCSRLRIDSRMGFQANFFNRKINPTKIKEGIENVNSIPRRLELKEGKQRTAIIDDTYNANPSAFQSAIEVLDGFQGKKILVIGDMAELGENSRIYHQELSRLIKETKIDITLGVGKYVKQVIELLDGKNAWFKSKDELVKNLYSCMKDATILVKGSRSMKMEEIVEKLIK